MISFILFCIGLILSVIGGIILPANLIVAMVLAIFGLVIGIVYVVYAEEDTSLHTLLLATIALLAMTAAFTPIAVMGIGKVVTSMLMYFAAMMAPVAVIAAIRALVKIGLGK